MGLAGGGRSRGLRGLPPAVYLPLQSFLWEWPSLLVSPRSIGPLSPLVSALPEGSERQRPGEEGKGTRRCKAGGFADFTEGPQAG